jgi:archaeal type IV pilus assembly protein PilA
MKGIGISVNRRAVAPVIATLLLVAIAVTGGTIVFIFSQNFMSYAQVSGYPSIEAMKFVGYDARDTDALITHDGSVLPAGTGGLADAVKQQDERIAIYVQNNSVKVKIVELRFAGDLYNFSGSAPILDVYTGTAPAQGEFVILSDTTGNLLQSSSGFIQPGQIATIILDIKDPIKIGRDAQIQILSSNGAVFVHTINVGQQSG